MPASSAYCRRCGTALKSAKPAAPVPATAPPPYRRRPRHGNPRPALVAAVLAASLGGMISSLRLASPPAAPVARPRRLVRPPALHRHLPPPQPQFGAPGTDVNWPLPTPPALPAPPTYPIPTWSVPAPPPVPAQDGTVTFRRTIPNPYRYPGAPAAAPRGYGRNDPYGRPSRAYTPEDRRSGADSQPREADDGRW